LTAARTVALEERIISVVPVARRRREEKNAKKIGKMEKPLDF